MTSPTRSPLDLLEPGVLLGGALARSLAASVELAELLAEGTRLGPFRIERQIGAGGMGVVYRAERDDGAFRQTVAIKSLPRRSGERSHELFLRERQILAELRHPHIARLIDGGRLEDGRLWFAMEHVEGARIDLHAHQRGLDVEARLHLLLEVIDAVGFAHGRLLIHRDIKPANVLVDGDGRAKLLDFGIATLAGDQDAARAYSPGWASPEQLAGTDVGPSSDQYQLGLLLDAMLRADGPAIESDGATRTALTVANATVHGAAVTPTRWLSMTELRRAELDSIARRASATAADARYGSVAEFADDLRRWLDRAPVRAYGGGLAYTLRCAVRRHPLVSAATCVAILALAVVVGVFSWRLAHQRDIAREAAERAEREATTAQAINQFLREDLIRAADPYGVNAKDVRIGELIEKAIPLVDQRLGGQAAIAGEVFLTLGQTLLNLGRHDAAAQALDLAAQRLLGGYGPLDERTIRARIAQADVAENAARYDEYGRLLAALRSDLAALDADHPLRIKVDRRHAWQGFVSGRFEEAALAFTALRERAERNPAEQGAELQYVLMGLSLSMARLNRFEESLTAATAARQASETLHGPDHINTLRTGPHIATALGGLGRTDEAVALLADLLARFHQRFGPDHTESITVAHEYGVSLLRVGRYTEAASVLGEVAEAKRKAFGAASGNTMNTFAQRALAQARGGDLDAAELTVRSIFDSGYVARNDVDRVSEAALRRTMGEVALERGRPAEALQHCRNSHALIEEVLPEGHPSRLLTRACLALAAFRVDPSAEHRAALAAAREPLAALAVASWWRERIDASLATP